MSSRKLKPSQLVLRCYAEKKDDQWQAFCLDFDLATQADSLDEAIHKMGEQINDYVNDALVGEDKEHASYLLSRRAPLSHWAKWYALCVAHKYLHMKDGVHQLFKKAMPLVPANA